MDSFVTYGYTCRICLLEFFIVLSPKSIKRFPTGKCDIYTRILQMNLPLVSSPETGLVNIKILTCFRFDVGKVAYIFLICSVCES